MKSFYRGIFTLISVISVVVYLVFQGIFIPNQISADKYEIKGVDVASYQGDIDWRVGKAKYEVCVYKGD